MSALGVDLSNFQPRQPGEWAGLDFGFVKATEGLGFIDHTFAQRWADMRSALPAQGLYTSYIRNSPGKLRRSFAGA